MKDPHTGTSSSLVYHFIYYKSSKWVWSGNTTITNCRRTHGTARQSHTTVTRHQEKLSAIRLYNSKGVMRHACASWFVAFVTCTYNGTLWENEWNRLMRIWNIKRAFQFIFWLTQRSPISWFIRIYCNKRYIGLQKLNYLMYILAKNCAMKLKWENR